MTTWQGKSIQVTAMLVPRYLWTTSTINVYLGGHCVLRTGGQAKLTGSYAATFTDGGAEHRVGLSWGKSRWFQFPYRLRIDDVLVEEALVPVENREMMLIPGFILGTLAFVFMAVLGLIARMAH